MNVFKWNANRFIEVTELSKTGNPRKPAYLGIYSTCIFKLINGIQTPTESAELIIDAEILYSQ